MKQREAYNSLLSKFVSPEAPVNRSIVIESRLSASVNVCKQILAELRDYNFNEDDIFAVHLALDEAFVDAVKHGNGKNPTKKVKIEYSVSSDKVEISIADEGHGFESESVADPRSGEGLYKYGGRGLLLMNSYMDIVKFNEPGNRVYMVRYKEKPDVTKGQSETEALSQTGSCRPVQGQNRW